MVPVWVSRPILKPATVPTDTFSIIGLDARHLAGALALSKEANWNQVEADWSMMIAGGEAIGFEDTNGHLIASALTLGYGDQFGWISMVIVSKTWRKQGLATQLLNACIQRLEEQGLVPVLDATPAGENVYRPLGFLPHFGFQRWEHEAAETITQNDPKEQKFQPLNRDQWPTLLENDLTVFGGDRQVVIKNLIERSAHFAAVTSGQDGFALGREGRVANQIGPICANSSEAAIALLDHTLAASTGVVFIDACDHQKEFTAHLKDCGFRPQRPFLSMAKGRAECFGQIEKMFAMAGPELG